jgi:hypothetical protein
LGLRNLAKENSYYLGVRLLNNNPQHQIMFDLHITIGNEISEIPFGKGAKFVLGELKSDKINNHNIMFRTFVLKNIITMGNMHNSFW